MNQRIEPLTGSALNELFVAINHYISTGDHLGQGLAVPVGPQQARSGEPHPADFIQVLIPYNITNDTDLDDLAAFKSRFAEVAPQFNTRLDAQEGRGVFGMVTFTICYRQAGPLAAALRQQPGPAGWGSLKPLIDLHFPARE